MTQITIPLISDFETENQIGTLTINEDYYRQMAEHFCDLHSTTGYILGGTANKDRVINFCLLKKEFS